MVSFSFRSFLLAAFPLAVSCYHTLLVTELVNSRYLSQSRCLSENYYGTYSDEYAVFLMGENCTEEATSVVDSEHVLPLGDGFLGEGRALIWITHSSARSEADAQDTLAVEDIIEKLDSKLREDAMQEVSNAGEQSILSPPGEIDGLWVLHRTSTSALLSIPSSALRYIDTILPRSYVLVALPETPYPLPQSYRQDPEDENTKRFIRLRENLVYNSSIASIINSIEAIQMSKDIRFLTGEDPASSIITRHSFTQGARKAAAWISDRISETGAECELKKFLIGFAPNVICRYPAIVDTTETILLSSHYDSRGYFGITRAPGANDDGSGTVSVLAMARAIATHRIRFRANVELVTFAGEEQGMLGSQAYAKQLKKEDRNLTLMIQSDMLAYHDPREPMQLGIPSIGNPELDKYVRSIAALYSPELFVGTTPACCSDHQSFHEQGFPAVMVNERAGDIIDPMYHNSRDLSDRPGYDLEQTRSITKVTFATLLHAAGFVVD